MKKMILILSVLMSVLPLSAKETFGWENSGEVNFSFAYARTWLGGQLRRQQWSCVKVFTIGKQNNIEHSVWERNGEYMQMMIWRIDSGRSGYSRGKIDNQDRKLK